jgi:hypothetical protein
MVSHPIELESSAICCEKFRSHMFALLHFMFQMFESPSLDSENHDNAVQPSTSETQNQVSKTPSPKKTSVVSTLTLSVPNLFLNFSTPCM